MLRKLEYATYSILEYRRDAFCSNFRLVSVFIGARPISESLLVVAFRAPLGTDMELGIVANDISYVGTERIVLRDVHFTVNPREICAVIGLSGSGKSTLLNLAAGLDDNIVGRSVVVQIANGGQNYSLLQARRLGLLGYVSSAENFVPWASVYENVEAIQSLNKKLPRISRLEIDELASAFKLTREALDQYPDQLSFGMRRRAAILKSLIYKPRIVLLDELTNGLDFANALTITSFLRNYVSQNSACCLFATHQLDHLRLICDRVLMINAMDGRLTEVTDWKVPNTLERLLARNLEDVT
ncbi:MAG TPA: ATP-binding cassette domain-containing protein [Rhizomicrobium sp.]|jgi:NitT/TauT family transport system ATP-binding protein|nr:ATP-binding cassette domain-containing protein [Rhizomicrobium sp.]